MGEELFSGAQLDQFAAQGFIVVRGVVDRAPRDACVRAINHWLVSEYDPACFQTYHKQTYAPSVAYGRATLDLLTETPVLRLATALVGQPLAVPECGQLALRFPAAPGTVPRVPAPHIDGLPSPANGVVADGHLHGFSVLAMVLLSDLAEENHGNFMVWPGTHVSVAAWFAEHGTYFPDITAVHDAGAAIAAGASEPAIVCGHAGDLVLAHPLLLHSGGPNVGPDIRYAAFFRLHTKARAAFGDSVYTDVWAEWDTIRQHRSAPSDAR